MDMSEETAKIWQVQNGHKRFDDGIEEKSISNGFVPPKYSNHLKELMELHGLTDDDIDYNTCKDCGCHHTRKAGRCSACAEKRKKIRDVKRTLISARSSKERVPVS